MSCEPVTLGCLTSSPSPTATPGCLAVLSVFTVLSGRSPAFFYSLDPLASSRQNKDWVNSMFIHADVYKRLQELLGGVGRAGPGSWRGPDASTVS